jgi:hypothetical protein
MKKSFTGQALAAVLTEKGLRPFLKERVFQEAVPL